MEANQSESEGLRVVNGDQSESEILLQAIGKLREFTEELHEALNGEKTISTRYLMAVVTQQRAQQDAMRAELNQLATKVDYAIQRIDRAAAAFKKLREDMSSSEHERPSLMKTG